LIKDGFRAARFHATRRAGPTGVFGTLRATRKSDIGGTEPLMGSGLPFGNHGAFFLDDRLGDFADTERESFGGREFTLAAMFLAAR
jgi:hypothetical protein